MDEVEELAVEAGDRRLFGDVAGSGAPIVLLHGLTASRRYVVHGSRTLARRGFRTFTYDARGHGSSDPAPAGEGEGYGYPELAGDLEAVLERVAPDRRALLAGHSMGAHTLTAFALGAPDRVAGLIAIGPVALGRSLEEDYAAWDRLADGLESDGVEGFLAVYDRDLDPEWREVLLRIARERLGLHRHPEAVAQALREVPRSQPFEDQSELELLDLPALVVASHDQADPGHPYAVAETWAQLLPQGRLISEQPGDSPLAWQGGRLSREIATFAESPEVAARLAA